MGLYEEILNQTCKYALQGVIGIADRGYVYLQDLLFTMLESINPNK